MTDENKQSPQPLSQAQGELLKRIQSSRPTRYLLRTTSDGTVHVFCANDALLYTLLTKQPVTLEAQPPTGEPFSLELTPDGPRRFDLWQSLVSDVETLPEVQGMPSKRCPYHHLFQEVRDAEAWRADLPPSLVPVVQIMSVREGWQRAKEQVLALAGADYEISASCRT